MKKDLIVFVDVNAVKDLGICNEELDFSLKEKLKLERFIKINEFLYVQAEKRNIGSKEVIDIVKNALKMLSDDLKMNEISDKTSQILSGMVESMENIVKSTYGLKDLNHSIIFWLKIRQRIAKTFIYISWIFLPNFRVI